MGTTKYFPVPLSAAITTNRLFSLHRYPDRVLVFQQALCGYATVKFRGSKATGKELLGIIELDGSAHFANMFNFLYKGNSAKYLKSCIIISLYTRVSTSFLGLDLFLIWLRNDILTDTVRVTFKSSFEMVRFSDFSAQEAGSKYLLIVTTNTECFTKLIFVQLFFQGSTTCIVDTKQNWSLYNIWGCSRLW